MRRTSTSYGGVALEVDGRTLASWSGDASADDRRLPTSQWTSLHLAITDASAELSPPFDASLTLTIEGEVVLGPVALPGWRLPASWRLGVAASALFRGDTHQARDDPGPTPTSPSLDPVPSF